MKTMKTWGYTALSLALVSCGVAQDTVSSKTKEPWNAANNPNRFEVQTGKLSDLPTEGKIPDDRYPWSDFYWATRSGGISYRWQIPNWNARTYKDYQYSWLTKDQIVGHSLTTPVATLSPAEKYDLLMGRYDFPLAKSERSATESAVDSRTGDVPGWFGICHGWAPASLMEPEPGALATMKNPDGVEIPFYTSDINALVSKVYAGGNAPSVMVGERCWDEGHAIRRDDQGRIIDSKCRDTNPATLHLVLASYLGKQDPVERHGFVMDMTYDDQVWNQAVTGYKVTNLTREPYNSSNDPAARFRAPGTKELANVDMEISYITEVGPHKTPMISEKDSYTSTMNISYTLELDANGVVIGGEWTSNERPDFLWKMNATPNTGRAYLSYDVVKGILEQSRQPNR